MRKSMHCKSCNCYQYGVKVTHLPTGIHATVSFERSQHRNREWAMRVLKSRLYMYLKEGKLYEKTTD